MILERSSKLLDFVLVCSDERVLLYLVNLKKITYCCSIGDKIRIEFGTTDGWIDIDMTLEDFYNGVRDTSISLGKKNFTLDFGGTINEN